MSPLTVNIRTTSREWRLEVGIMPSVVVRAALSWFDNEFNAIVSE